METNNDMTERGVADQIKGTAKEVGGKIRGDLGDALDRGGEHLKGRAQEAAGNVQKNFGKVEQKIDEKLTKRTDEKRGDRSQKG